MTTFTTVPKHRLSWQAPETVAAGAPEVDFVFSDGVDFLFQTAQILYLEHQLRRGYQQRGLV